MNFPDIPGGQQQAGKAANGQCDPKSDTDKLLFALVKCDDMHNRLRIFHGFVFGVIEECHGQLHAMLSFCRCSVLLGELDEIGSSEEFC